jgi:hypothetical protein
MFDRMSPEKLARAKSQAHNTNRRNELAHRANGFGVSRAEKRNAEAALIGEVGAGEAKKLMRQAEDKVIKARGWV